MNHNLFLFLFFFLGLNFGSFYNVCIYRIPKKIDITKGRSFCPNCEIKLSVLELIPLLSFIFQGGKCKTCKNKISYQYPFVEFITGILFALAYIIGGLTLQTILLIFVFSLLIVIIGIRVN